MRLKNVLIVVKDIEKSCKFYHDLFGLDVVVNNDGNVIPENNSCELYFEERNIEAFAEKLEKL